jgi:hypothetical protein
MRFGGRPNHSDDRCNPDLRVLGNALAGRRQVRQNREYQTYGDAPALLQTQPSHLVKPQGLWSRDILGTSILNGSREASMRKALPASMFVDPEQCRLTALRAWVLDQQVSEIEMNERQFWNFAQLQPLAEKPWTTFMGRPVSVPNMPESAQKCLGIFDKRLPGVI